MFTTFVKVKRSITTVLSIFCLFVAVSTSTFYAIPSASAPTAEANPAEQSLSNSKKLSNDQLDAAIATLQLEVTLNVKVLTSLISDSPESTELDTIKTALFKSEIISVVETLEKNEILPSLTFVKRRLLKIAERLLNNYTEEKTDYANKVRLLGNTSTLTSQVLLHELLELKQKEPESEKEKESDKTTRRTQTTKLFKEVQENFKKVSTILSQVDSHQSFVANINILTAMDLKSIVRYVAFLTRRSSVISDEISVQTLIQTLKTQFPETSATSNTLTFNQNACNKLEAVKLQSLYKSIDEYQTDLIESTSQHILAVKGVLDVEIATHIINNLIGVDMPKNTENITLDQTKNLVKDKLKVVTNLELVKTFIQTKLDDKNTQIKDAVENYSKKLVSEKSFSAINESNKLNQFNKAVSQMTTLTEKQLAKLIQTLQTDISTTVDTLTSKTSSSLNPANTRQQSLKVIANLITGSLIVESYQSRNQSDSQLTTLIDTFKSEIETWRTTVQNIRQTSDTTQLVTLVKDTATSTDDKKPQIAEILVDTIHSSVTVDQDKKLKANIINKAIKELAANADSLLIDQDTTQKISWVTRATSVTDQLQQIQNISQEVAKIKTLAEANKLPVDTTELQKALAKFISIENQLREIPQLKQVFSTLMTQFDNNTYDATSIVSVLQTKLPDTEQKRKVLKEILSKVKQDTSDMQKLNTADVDNVDTLDIDEIISKTKDINKMLNMANVVKTVCQNLKLTLSDTDAIITEIKDTKSNVKAKTKHILVAKIAKIAKKDVTEQNTRKTELEELLNKITDDQNQQDVSTQVSILNIVMQELKENAKGTISDISATNLLLIENILKTLKHIQTITTQNDKLKNQVDLINHVKSVLDQIQDIKVDAEKNDNVLTKVNTIWAKLQPLSLQDLDDKDSIDKVVTDIAQIFTDIEIDSIFTDIKTDSTDKDTPKQVMKESVNNLEKKLQEAVQKAKEVEVTSTLEMFNTTFDQTATQINKFPKYVEIVREVAQKVDLANILADTDVKKILDKLEIESAPNNVASMKKQLKTKMGINSIVNIKNLPEADDKKTQLKSVLVQLHNDIGVDVESVVGTVMGKLLTETTAALTNEQFTTVASNKDLISKIIEVSKQKPLESTEITKLAEAGQVKLRSAIGTKVKSRNETATSQISKATGTVSEITTIIESALKTAVNDNLEHDTDAEIQVIKAVTNKLEAGAKTAITNMNKNEAATLKTLAESLETYCNGNNGYQPILKANDNQLSNKLIQIKKVETDVDAEIKKVKDAKDAKDKADKAAADKKAKNNTKGNYKVLKIVGITIVAVGGVAGIIYVAYPKSTTTSPLLGYEKQKSTLGRILYQIKSFITG